jgi:hypothetical protein
MAKNSKDKTEQEDVDLEYAELKFSNKAKTTEDVDLEYADLQNQSGLEYASLKGFNPPRTSKENAQQIEKQRENKINRKQSTETEYATIHNTGEKKNNDTEYASVHDTGEQYTRVDENVNKHNTQRSKTNYDATRKTSKIEDDNVFELMSDEEYADMPTDQAFKKYNSQEQGSNTLFSIWTNTFNNVIDSIKNTFNNIFDKITVGNKDKFSQEELNKHLYGPEGKSNSLAEGEYAEPIFKSDNKRKKNEYEYDQPDYEYKPLDPDKHEYAEPNVNVESNEKSGNDEVAYTSVDFSQNDKKPQPDDLEPTYTELDHVTPKNGPKHKDPDKVIYTNTNLENERTQPQGDGLIYAEIDHKVKNQAENIGKGLKTKQQEPETKPRLNTTPARSSGNEGRSV